MITLLTNAQCKNLGQQIGKTILYVEEWANVLFVRFVKGSPRFLSKRVLSNEESAEESAAKQVAQDARITLEAATKTVSFVAACEGISGTLAFRTTNFFHRMEEARNWNTFVKINFKPDFSPQVKKAKEELASKLLQGSEAQVSWAVDIISRCPDAIFVGLYKISKADTSLASWWIKNRYLARP